jgi:predicted nucleic-acid-binding protein
MQAVDTNVLVRILIDDTKQIEQVQIARRHAKKAKQLFVPQIVQVELIWVLDTAYELEKTEIIFILKHMQENEAFILQNEPQYAEALHHYQTSNADFSDCLILAESNEAKCEVITFDKKFSRLPNVKQLTQ